MSLWKRYVSKLSSLPRPFLIQNQNLREEMAMDVDEDENATQRPKIVADYGIQVDFDSIDQDSGEDPAQLLAKLDKEIADKIAEIERMAPNMKAMERLAPS